MITTTHNIFIYI